jgi:hypothetical protein
MAHLSRALFGRAVKKSISLRSCTNEAKAAEFIFNNYFETKKVIVNVFVLKKLLIVVSML